MRRGIVRYSTSAPIFKKLPLKLLTRGYTINAARALRMEDRIGSIETGKAADFVVLQQNIMKVAPYTLHTIKPNAVVMDAKLIQGSLPAARR